MTELLIMLAVILVLTMHKYKTDKGYQYALILSFTIMTVFFAIRYDYGLDYWAYQEMFYSEATEMNRGTGERFFLWFMRLFNKYYIFVIVHTIIFSVVLFYYVRKYMPPRYFALFFFTFLLTSTAAFNLISAMRTTLAAVVIWFAIEYFYLRKTNYLLFLLAVFIACQFHTSAVAFVVFPLIAIVFKKLNPFALFGIIVGMNLLSLTNVNDIYALVFSLDKSLDYSGYMNVLGNNSILGMLNRCMELPVWYFMCKNIPKFNDSQKKIVYLSSFYLLICNAGVDFQGRYTLFLLIFYVIAAAFTFKVENTLNKGIGLTCIIVHVLFNFIIFLNTLKALQYTVWSEGNYLYYHTIFDAPFLP